MGTVTIALAQLRVIANNKQANLVRACRTMEEAKKRGADYVLFPEMFVSGFFIGDTIGQLAEPADGESITMIRACAKKYGIGVMIGFPERYQGRYYNSAAFVDRNGDLKGVFRKVHLYDKEKDFMHYGTDCPVFETDFGTVGLIISYDMEFPEIPRILALKGAQVVFILASNMVPFQHYQNVLLRARAMENHVFTALVNKVGLEEETLFFGESEVIAPDGRSLYLAGNDEELGVITIDLSAIDQIRETYPFNYLESRRPHVYSMNRLGGKFPAL